MEKILTAAQTSLKLRPVTLEAFRKLAKLGLTHNTFVPGPHQPWQSFHDYWAVLKIEAREKKRQLTAKEVTESIKEHLDMVKYLYALCYRGEEGASKLFQNLSSHSREIITETIVNKKLRRASKRKLF